MFNHYELAANVSDMQGFNYRNSIFFRIGNKKKWSFVFEIFTKEAF